MAAIHAVKNDKSLPQIVPVERGSDVYISGNWVVAEETPDTENNPPRHPRLRHPRPLPTFPGNLNLGRKSIIDPGDDRTYWGGSIDDMRFYNRALSDAELNRIFSTAPYIQRQPKSQLAYWGRGATFEVVAYGVSPLGYQWRKEGAPIPGATSTIFLRPKGRNKRR